MAALGPPRLQSGPKGRSAKPGKGNRYLRGVLGEVAAGVARTDTFLGERYGRLVRRRGKQRALDGISPSVLVIIWHLLADPAARFSDLGSVYHNKHLNNDRRGRDSSASSTPSATK